MELAACSECPRCVLHPAACGVPTPSTAPTDVFATEHSATSLEDTFGRHAIGSWLWRSWDSPPPQSAVPMKCPTAGAGGAGQSAACGWQGKDRRPPKVLSGPHCGPSCHPVASMSLQNCHLGRLIGGKNENS